MEPVPTVQFLTASLVQRIWTVVGPGVLALRNTMMNYYAYSGCASIPSPLCHRTREGLLCENFECVTNQRISISTAAPYLCRLSTSFEMLLCKREKLRLGKTSELVLVGSEAGITPLFGPMELSVVLLGSEAILPLLPERRELSVVWQRVQYPCFELQ